jgi:hypothetical protein
MPQHYAMIGMAAVIQAYPLYFEATNEKGLSLAGLNFPDNACYGNCDPEKENVASFELIPYLLGSCATVDEVTQKLNAVNVVDYHDVDSLCFDALAEMLGDLSAAGIEYTFNSAYRTILEQTTILEYRTREHMKNYGLDFYAARDKAYETVAIPGTSEHHLGLAVDLLGNEAVAWLSEHCWDYGFIVRYTEDKEHITGIIDEPWHFRYVGQEVSLDMKDSGLCLEEYLGAEAVTFRKAKALYGDDLYLETVYQPPVTPEPPATEPAPVQDAESVETTAPTVPAEAAA